MEHNNTQPPPDPSKIMQVGMGFWASKAMLAAVKLRLFTLLSEKKQLTGTEIKAALGLQTTDRHVYDWLDTLTCFGFIERQGLLEEARYSNQADVDLFLDVKKPSYVGGILEMANNRLYTFWGSLEEALLTGLPQNETKGNLVGEGFEVLYQSPEKLQEFMDAMSGIQTGNFMALSKKFNFDDYNSVADIGGADAWLSIHLCLQHPQLNCISYDLPPVEPLAKKKVEQFFLQDRIEIRSGDFFKDSLPTAEIITMGNILHGLNEQAKQETVQKVYDALPANGVFIAIENIIDEDRRQNAFGLMMSLNMLIENGDAFDYTFPDFQKWTATAGFSRSEIIALTGPASAAIAYK